MTFSTKAKQVAQQILTAFQNGSLPQAITPVFLHCNENVPCRKWSWLNRIIVALSGYSDARGVRQWNEVGRWVRKGEKAIYILVPCVVPSKEEPDEDGKRKEILVGFRSAPVFGYEQTDGKPLPDRQHAEEVMNALPLRNVAQAWGLRVDYFGGREKGAAGWYAPGSKVIGLGVENLSTWAHELVHAADDRLGCLTERGQQWTSEIVAELGGATLLRLIGHDREADVGGAWKYIERYCREARVDPIAACISMLNRICQAVDLILTTADESKSAGTPGKAA